MSKLELFPHQQKTLDQTKNFNRVGYFLDMGLGKTFCASEKIQSLDENSSLLICQKTKVGDWTEHFETYYDHNIIIYKKQLIKDTPDNSIIITTYDLAWRRPEINNLTDFTLILDESQLIKNENTKRAKFILKLKPKNVILLSGTPTDGKYEKLYSQLKLLGWNISKKLFYSQYIISETHKTGEGEEAKYFKTVVGYKNVDRLKRKLRQHGAVFLKTEEVFDLPEQVPITIKIKNTKEYRRFKRDRLIMIDGKELVGDTTLTKRLYLRQLAGIYNKHKLAGLEDLLVSTEDRIIVFYNFKDESKLIKNLCAKLDKPVSTINGDGVNLDSYKNHSNSVTLCQYQSGSRGHNLQLSNKIIYYTLPEMSELFEQSKKRIHRIGQKYTCFYYYLLVENSIEYKILKTLKLRKDFTDKLFEECDY